MRAVGLILALASLSLLPGTVRSAAAASQVQVVSDTATANFPTKMTFSLTADAPQNVTAAEVRYHAAFAPTTELVRATVPGGSHISPSVSVDMQTHYLPPGVDVIYHWRLTLADGSTVDTPEQTLFYMDQQHSWNKLTAGQVTVYYYAGTQRFGQQMLDTTTQAIDQLKARFHVTADQPVRVVVYGSNKDLLSSLPPNSAEWIGGYTEPELHIVVTGIAAGDTSEVQRILSHESVHLITYQATLNPFNEPPPWLDEGLATYYQQVPDTRFPATLNQAVKSGQLIPLEALDAPFPDDANRALLSYAESRSVVQFIIEQKGEDKMAALIATFPKGVSYEQAVEQGLGESEAQLDHEWKAWLGYGGDKPAASIAPAGTQTVGTGAAHYHLIDLSAIALLASAGTGVVVRRRQARDHGARPR